MALVPVSVRREDERASIAADCTTMSAATAHGTQRNDDPRQPATRNATDATSPGSAQ